MGIDQMIYICEEEEMAKLEAIKKRLYAPETLFYNERRDVAHRLELIIDNIKLNIEDD